MNKVSGSITVNKKKEKRKMPNKWITIKSLVHKIRLHGRRGKGTAESFSREKSRHAPQKEGGIEILCDPGWYFAAILGVVLERFSKDAGILADLIHLQEQPSKVGPETTLECVRRAIWGMLYADDACIVSRSPRGLRRMMAVFVEVFGTFGLTISEQDGEHVHADPACTNKRR